MLQPRKCYALPLLLGGLITCRGADDRIDLSRYVMIYPGSPVVEMPGPSAEMSIKVRNVSEIKLTRLRLQVESEVCTATVNPATIPEIIPGDRKQFSVKLARKSDKDRQRYPLLLTLYADGLPVPAGLDLMVDLGKALDGGWIDVGKVTLVHREHSRTVYYLLAGVPLLLIVGWMLWRWSHPKKNRRESGP